MIEVIHAITTMKGGKIIGEIKMIPVWREKGKEPVKKRKHKVDYRDKVIVAQWFIIGAFAVLAYILQAGPV